MHFSSFRQLKMDVPNKYSTLRLFCRPPSDMLQIILIAYVTCLEISPTENQLHARGYISPLQTCPALCSCSPYVTQTENMDIICNTDQFDGEDINQVINMILNELKPNLTILEITNSRLSIVPEAICQMTTLQELNLTNNIITDLPVDCFTKLSRLMKLRLSYNRISKLGVGVIERLQKLELLDLGYNILDKIDPRVFSNKSDLISLSYISFFNNQLTHLDPWPFVRAQAVPGCIVNLSKNRIKTFTNEINWNFNCSMEVPNLKLSIDKNPIEHFSDILRGWNFKNFTDFICLFGNKKNSNFHITMRYIYFVCDCRDFLILRIIKAFKYVTIFEATQCNNINSSVEAVRFASVPLDNLECDIPDQCPEKCKCTRQPSTRTIHVNCHNTDLVGMPLRLPPIKPESTYRYNVTLSGNSLETLGYVDYFSKIRTFNVRLSRVKIIKDEVWRAFQYMDEVNLEGNRITHIPRLVEQLNFSNVQLNIANNPMSCKCDDQWLKSWLTSVRRSLKTPSSITCDTPGWVRGKNVLSMTSEFCSGPPYTTAEHLGNCYSHNRWCRFIEHVPRFLIPEVPYTYLQVCQAASI